MRFTGVFNLDSCFKIAPIQRVRDCIEYHRLQYAARQWMHTYHVTHFTHVLVEKNGGGRVEEVWHVRLSPNPRQRGGLGAVQGSRAVQRHALSAILQGWPAGKGKQLTLHQVASFYQSTTRVGTYSTVLFWRLRTGLVVCTRTEEWPVSHISY